MGLSRVKPRDIASLDHFKFFQKGLSRVEPQGIALLDHFQFFQKGLSRVKPFLVPNNLLKLLPESS